MLRLLLSFCVPPLTFLLVLDGIAACICRWLLSRGFSGAESAVHSAKAAVYFLIAGGLTLSMICASAGIVLALIAVLIKRHRRALLFSCITLAAALLWRYFLLQPYFL